MVARVLMKNMPEAFNKLHVFDHATRLLDVHDFAEDIMQRGSVQDDAGRAAAAAPGSHLQSTGVQSYSKLTVMSYNFAQDDAGRAAAAAQHCDALHRAGSHSAGAGAKGAHSDIMADCGRP